MRNSKFAPLFDRFMSFVEPDTNGGCWLWSGSINQFGYGQLNIHGKHNQSHRVSYTLHNGSIPDGLHVMHKCDVRACVNPKHLTLGTHKDNMRDASRKGRLNSGVSFVRLTQDQISTIHSMRGRPKRAIARVIGVSPSTVRRHLGVQR